MAKTVAQRRVLRCLRIAVVLPGLAVGSDGERKPIEKPIRRSIETNSH